MKVIYSVGARFPGGGIGNVACHAVGGIYKHGYLKKLLCLSSKRTEIDPSKVEKIGSIYYSGLVLHGVRKFLYPKFNPYLYINRWYDYFASRHVEECDIFHGWNNHSLQSLRKAKGLGAKAIIERASSHPLTQDRLLKEEYQRYGIKVPTNPFLKRSCKELEECDYVTIPSDFVRKSFIEQGFDEDKLIQIPFGVNIDKFKPVKKKDNVFRAIFVGSIQLRKGIQYLLEAWGSLNLKNAELLICGGIHEDAKNLVRKYQQNKSIRFLGYVGSVPYEGTDVFVFPSIEEGSALVTYEAMASELPIIATYNTGSIARDGKDGFVIAIRDVDALKEKIRYCYDNPEKVRKMGNDARKHVEKYTWARYGDELVKAYEKIVK
ncbi:D-inositol-3-phosphate glycosyltransferase [subsurface metagenome]